MKYKVYKSRDAPKNWGVQAIVYEYEPTGWSIAAGNDYYIQRENRWVGVDLCGMLDYVINELGVVMAGRTISTQEYNDIIQKAMDDRDFAKKSGYLPRERKP